MTIKRVDARCINCKTEIKPEHENCPKCGDRVKPSKRNIFEEIMAEAGDVVLKGDETGEPREIANGLVTVVRETPMSVPAGNPPPFEGNVAQVTLSPEQEKALDAIQGWYLGTDHRDPFYLAGYAGTGKTTLAKHLAAALNVSPFFGAYTGKAAHVLRRKGVPATTIHSAIYTPRDKVQMRRNLEMLQRKLAGSDDALFGFSDDEEWTQEELTSEIERLESELAHGGFVFNPESEWAYADLIVLDEVSMVNTTMARDIESFGNPVLVLGDPAQLPPIEGGGHYTKHAPDFQLTKVHRQALDSPVLALATDIRKGVAWPYERVNLAKAMEADQIIVWKNSTRWNLIEKIRAKLGRPAGTPVPGDRIMCLVNNRDAGILNGQQFEVLEATPGTLGYEIRARDEEGHERALTAFEAGFRGLQAEQEARKTLTAWKGRRGLFTFANAITAHKAQGSEWPSVYVVDQTPQMWSSTTVEKRQWCYTAVTRASESVTIARTGA